MVEMVLAKIAATALDKAINKCFDLISLGYRKLDSNTSFLSAYENALSSYKNMHQEDTLYNVLYKTDDFQYYYKEIQDTIDNLFPSRELLNGIVSFLNDSLSNCNKEQINDFLTCIFTELLLTSEYQDKIIKCRQDIEIGETYNRIDKLLSSNNITPKFYNNEYQHFLDIWNDYLFLHRKTKNIRLKDLYILPYYKKSNSFISDEEEHKNDIFTDLDEKIDLFLSDNIAGTIRRPMIVLADAGMGKSSLVSYICSKCPMKENLIILRFNSLKKEILDKNIMDSVKAKLNCDIDDLQNKRLIIDGFDECTFTTDKDNILSNFFNDCQNISGLKVLITSRVHYIGVKHFSKCEIFYLQFMNKEQIENMCEQYFKLSKKDVFTINTELNNQVIGIPLILYMALSLEIPIEDQTSICELYEKIFAFDGGIYDRMTLEDEGYSDKIHFIAYDNIKKEMHLISQNLAFAMFDILSLALPKKEYTKIVKNISEDRLKDFAIANYYYITDKSLTFAHKSIYEYFLAEYIFNSINDALKNNNIEETLASLFIYGELSEEIICNIIYKIKKQKSDSKLYYHIESSFNNMVENGMSYFLENKVKNFLRTESNVFENVLKVLDAYSILLKPKQYKKIKLYYPFFYQLRNSFNREIKNLTKTLWINVSIPYGCYLQNLNLNDSIIKNSDFFTDFTDTLLKNVKIQNCNFFNSIFKICFFQNATFRSINFLADFYNCAFNHVLMNNIDFYMSECVKLDLSNSTLKNIVFNKAVMKDIIFSAATLIDIDFSRTTLINIDFSVAKLIQYDTITIDSRTTFENVTIDIEFLPIILENTQKITNLIIVDKANDRKLTLEEYKELYSLN